MIVVATVIVVDTATGAVIEVATIIVEVATKIRAAIRTTEVVVTMIDPTAAATAEVVTMTEVATVTVVAIMIVVATRDEVADTMIEEGEATTVTMETGTTKVVHHRDLPGRHISYHYPP